MPVVHYGRTRGNTTLAAVISNLDGDPEPIELAKPRSGRSVYFLHAPELRRVKIGFSQHPPSRLEAIKRLIPKDFELRLLGGIDGGRRMERVIHERFAEHRISGEWFDDCILSDVHELIAEDREWFGDAA